MPYRPPMIFQTNEGRPQQVNNRVLSNENYDEIADATGIDFRTIAFSDLTMKRADPPMDSQAIHFPQDLGSKGNEHFVEFSIYDIKTNASDVTSMGDSFATQDVYNSATGEVEKRPIRTTVDRGRTQSSNDIVINKYAKISKSICLPIPQAVVCDHSTIWSRAEGGMLAGASDMVDVFRTESRTSAALQNAKTIAMKSAAGITNLFSQFGFDGGETALKRSTGRAINPRNEFLFDGVNNRSFSMDWTFIPSSATEAAELHKLINDFKHYMYPELDQGTTGGFYFFPALFEIMFMTGGSENKWLYKTSSCALTNVLINYTGAGQWVAMEDDSSPFAVQLTMQFVETEFLHRKRFRDEAVR